MTVVVAAVVPIASSAQGVDTSSLDGVSVRQLQNQVQLPQTPDASVPVPSVPQVSTPSVPSVSTPSVPSVSTPVPQVSTPSVPSVSTPSVPSTSTPSVKTPSSGSSSSSSSSGGGGGSSSNASSGPVAPGTPAGSATAGSPGSPAARAAARRAAASTPQARARRRAAHERRLRSEVREFQGCLGSLNDLDRRYLTLRAGLDGPPQSQGQAARQLGITRSDARVIERHGLRQLRFACGGNAGSTHNIAATAPHMLQLQDASLLMATGSGAPSRLVDQSRLSGPQHGVKGAHASSPESEGSGTLETSLSRPLATVSSEGIGAAWVAIFAALALMTAIALGPLRRRSLREGPAQVGRARVAPLLPPPPPLPPVLSLPRREERVVPPPPPLSPPEPDPVPAPERERSPAPPRFEVAQPQPQPEPQPAPARRRDYRRAAMIASGVASVAARELMRRRRRGR